MKESLGELIEIIKKCRKECPWTKLQTIESFGKEIMSETEEIVQAIKNNDNENLKEELGDAIYDLLNLTVIASEELDFNPEEVIHLIKQKIVRRKPWVFGDAKVETAEEAIAMWNDIKKKEKEGKI